MLLIKMANVLNTLRALCFSFIPVITFILIIFVSNQYVPPWYTLLLLLIAYILSLWTIDTFNTIFIIYVIALLFISILIIYKLWYIIKNF